MTSDRAVSAFAPATVANVLCGFDIFGLALEAPGDVVTVRPRAEPGLLITSIEGDHGRIPKDPRRNSATVAIRALLELTGRSDQGLEVSLVKGLPLSGGMGGSAASSVAAVVAADALLGTRGSPELLLEAALAGEGMASGDAHMDNIGPALFGGLLLLRPGSRFPIVRLPIPEGLSTAVLHPAVEMSTRSGRVAMGHSVPLKDAVAQWGHTAAFVQSLHTGDFDLMADALQDRIAEPHRSPRIPAFREVREAALAAGAIGCGISGSGPSMVSICRSEESAAAVGRAMFDTFSALAEEEAALYLSAVAPRGARVVESPEEAPR